MKVTKEQIVKLLVENDRAVGRALIVLNERQTLDEQRAEQTRNLNGEGFVPCDAFMGTRMAEYYAKFNKLSEKQLAYWRKPNAKGVPRICKYAGQLVKIAEARSAAQSN